VLPINKAAPEDAVIGKMIAEMVPHGACLQMGVGVLPNLVCPQLVTAMRCTNTQWQSWQSPKCEVGRAADT
jgi:acyl-CoA hydrolase